ncbi:MAG: anti-sigma-factor antagonist [Acidobacteriaceae bacterium]|nr:anti-sigma-factor antagonist [Acidobacteriaceae bacterium]
MPVVLRKLGDAVIVDLDGRLALGGPVDEFRARWMEALASGAKTIVVNLARVTMIDSSGIGTMIRCHSAVSAAGGKLKIVGANHTVREAFRVTRLDKVFEFHENESIALGLSGVSASAGS